MYNWRVWVTVKAMIYLLIFACVVVVGLLALFAMLVWVVKDVVRSMRDAAESKAEEYDAIGDMMAKVFYPPMREANDDAVDDEDLEWALPQHEVDDETLEWIKEQMAEVSVTDFVTNYHPDHEDDSGMFAAKEEDAEDNA